MTETPSPDDFLVVGIGASAGGLEACRQFLRALPAKSGMAFVLILHLDPNHESLMADLLAGYTTMRVEQARSGISIEPDHLYIIPPGVYLAVKDGLFQLSQPEAAHGLRLPFDFWLKSQARAYGARSVCVVLSGSGADGSLGLKAIHLRGGKILVQDPRSAEYDGMPQSAVASKLADDILDIAGLADRLVHYGATLTERLVESHTMSSNFVKDAQTVAGTEDEHTHEVNLKAIVELLHARTGRDFNLYKVGTLRRRVERRMAMAEVADNDMKGYITKLKSDAVELEALSKDILINVTSFFRDEKTFDYLQEVIIPDLIANHALPMPLRVWVAGCSTGEEAYSLGMLLLEEMRTAKRNIKLQIFASDLDPDAIAIARDGIYTQAMVSEIDSERLKRFFTKEGDNFRIVSELRNLVIFTVQDLLSDPPFSRLDLVSCRNLLIYLGSDAQSRAISLFHFALRNGGLMLLGSAETPGPIEGRFEVVSKADRVYRRIGRIGMINLKLPLDLEKEGSALPKTTRPSVPSKQSALADQCRRWVIETYAPAVVLVNMKYECIYSLGPIEQFLTVPQGYSTLDVLAMASPALRNRLKAALTRLGPKPPAGTLIEDIVLGDSKTPQDSKPGDDKRRARGPGLKFDIKAYHHDGEDFLLIGFHEPPRPIEDGAIAAQRADTQDLAKTQEELKGVRRELFEALQNLEILSEDHRTINEESLSVNEEYQSTNEELLTSKEELQSLNEELTALNGQLQETLELKRTAANDLQNVLYSTNIATLFLDTHLNIRLFTPATKSLFHIIPTDIGRPLNDLKSLTGDDELTHEAQKVMKSLRVAESEIKTPDGQWFVRRILPYRTDGKAVEGVVITYNDITERKAIAEALEVARLRAEQANLAKSRFLAAVSHDLRQPLQSLGLLQGLLAKMAEGAGAEKLVKRLEETLETMAGMLNTLLDINQFEAGKVKAIKVDFHLGALLTKMRNEFDYVAKASGLDLRIMDCSKSVRTDPVLLEQIVRNLIANALKYTRKGKVLVGVRHLGGYLRLDICDTGIGIPRSDLEQIFEEYHQVDNEARQRSQGLGLGLSIVQRLGRILNHRVQVRSNMGRGSVFSVEIERSSEADLALPFDADAHDDEIISAEVPTQAKVAIMVIEDDPEVRELLSLLLENEGHEVLAVPDGLEALEALTRGAIRPRLVLADYNLPNGLNGTAVAERLRDLIVTDLPVIILTGDISTATERDIASHNCVRLSKPVKLDELMQTIERLLPKLDETPIAAKPDSEPGIKPPGPMGAALIYVIDDDAGIREDMRDVLLDEGYRVETFVDGETFLTAFRPGVEACLLIDAYLPGMDGLTILQTLRKAGHAVPAIMITGLSDLATAVSAMKAGASDFLQKPIHTSDLLKCLRGALELSRDSDQVSAMQENAAHQLAGLTQRQRQIMNMVLAGHPSKNIAADLNISQRTVENHRAAIMAKAGVKSLPALARIAIAAFGTDAGKLES